MAVYSFLSRGVAAACLLGSARGVAVEVRADGQLSTQEAHQSLVICNAYAHSAAMTVKNLRTSFALTEKNGLAYKECSLYKPTLHEGDRLEFKAGNTTVGIFRATALPKNVDTLMLVPHRRVASSLNCAFDSHAFAPASGPQIATVDAYRGKESGKIRITDTAASGQKQSDTRSEDLKFNSVVSLAPGEYQVFLDGGDGKEISNSKLHVVQGDAKYVVMRAGISVDDKNQTNPFPQELVIFEHRSGAAAMGMGLLVAAAISCMNLARWV